MEEHGRIKVMQGDIRIAHQQHGTRGATIKRIEVSRKQLDLKPTFNLDGWMLMIGTNWLRCLVDHIICLPSMF